MDIRIFQIYFAKWQRAGLDPAFIPYDNSPCPNPDWREFYVFRKEYLAGETKGSGYTGYFSWKFKAKTHLTGADFTKFCADHPGADVYFINPFPLSFYLGNVWANGEFHHPGITQLAQRLLDAVGYDIDLKTLPANLRTNAYCNYWVGNAKFWDQFMRFCLPVWDYLENDAPSDLRRELFSRADRITKASYFSYLFERLFTTFLLSHPDIKSQAFIYTEKELRGRFTPHEITLILEAQRLEKAYPNDPEAIRRDPVFMAALHYYFGAMAERSVFKQLSYRFIHLLWRKLPFRKAFLRLARLERTSKNLVEDLRAELPSPFSGTHEGS